MQHELVQLTTKIHMLQITQIDTINLRDMQDRYNDRMYVLIVVLLAIIPGIVPVPIFNNGSIDRWRCFQEFI